MWGFFYALMCALYLHTCAVGLLFARADNILDAISSARIIKKKVNYG